MVSLEKENIVDFNGILDNYIENKSSSHEFERDEGIHASAIGYCLRKQFYDITNPIKPTKEVKRIFEVGNIFHRYFTKVLEQSDKVSSVQSEQKIKILVEPPGFVIHGTYDDLVRLKDNKVILLDKKTMKNLYYIEKPDKKHLLQLHLYMKSAGVNDGQLTYIGKNSLEVKNFAVKFDEKIYKEAIERAKMLYKFLKKKNELPPAEAREIQEDKWQCEYCSYNLRCSLNRFGEDDEKK